MDPFRASEALGRSQAVRQRVLVPPSQVRILAPQPIPNATTGGLWLPASSKADHNSAVETATMRRRMRPSQNATESECGLNIGPIGDCTRQRRCKSSPGRYRAGERTRCRSAESARSSRPSSSAALDGACIFLDTEARASMPKASALCSWIFSGADFSRTTLGLHCGLTQTRCGIADAVSQGWREVLVKAGEVGAARLRPLASAYFPSQSLS
jgi:hypothetical protein